MPHIVIKLWPGKSDAQKHELAERITGAMGEVMGNGDKSISVLFEEVDPDDWMETVYDAEIAPNWDRLTKAPGYGPGKP